MDIFKTTDIVLAAVLRLRDIELIEIEIDGHKGTFVFNTVPNDLVASYNLGNCSVEPIAFHNTIKQLVTAIRYQTRDE